jgi:hypothetical protein
MSNRDAATARLRQYALLLAWSVGGEGIEEIWMDKSDHEVNKGDRVKRVTIHVTVSYEIRTVLSKRS